VSLATVPALHFDAASHTYTLGGRKVPGVTTVLKPISEAFYGGSMGPAMRAKAQLGTLVHLAIELDGAGTLDRDSLEGPVLDYFRAWERFRRESEVELVAQELKVASPTYGYAGALDILGRLRSRPGRIALIDAKCVTTVMPTTGPQTAGYEKAAREWHPELIPEGHPVDRYALQLRPDGTYRLVPFTSPADLRTFLAALSVHNFIQEHA